MRILLVSQMYPGPDDPDLGVFVQGIERALADRGLELERAVLDGRGGGKRRHLRLARTTARAARRFHPDVVYAHFLVPTGLSAALVTRAPLVVTAHGRDVRNIGAYPGIRAATRFVARRSASLVAVSDYLRRELETKIPEARGKTEVVDCGVDLDLFVGSDAPSTDGPVFLCVGSLNGSSSPSAGAALPGPGDGRLPAVHDRAFRPGPAGGDGLRALGRRHSHRRPTGVRPAGGRPARRPPRRGGARRRDAARGRPSEPESGRAGSRGRARRQASGRADRDDPGKSRSRSASLIATSGRILSSSPASRARSSACS